MASGLDIVYPPENAKLAEEIAEHGALVTDYPLGTHPRAEYFPRRNRIMSGLALGVLIAEGDYKSGAMITARFAVEQNREVFAVPGSIFSPQSRGPLSLIKDGATPVSTADDVLEALNLTMIGTQMDFGRAAPAASAEEQTLLAALSREPRHVDANRAREQFGRSHSLRYARSTGIEGAGARSGRHAIRPAARGRGALRRFGNFPAAGIELTMQRRAPS